MPETFAFMKNHRSLLAASMCAALVLLAAIVPLRAEVWETDYAKALKLAKESNKTVLLDFTGSDWCGWCIKLDKEVFSQGQFKEYAKDNLVLVKLDFPRRIQLPVATVKQNKDLAAQYKIEGYPTIIVLNSSGKQVGQLGYMEGGPSKFIEALKALPKG
jgi:thioredoxin-related protein